MASRDLDVNLDLLVSVTGSLASSVGRFYGPQCYQTLMTTSTGRVAVTSDGMTIMDALHFSHPIAQMIKGALAGCHSYTKDGSKTFLIYLSEILRGMKVAISTGKVQTSSSKAGNRSSLERQCLIQLLKCLRSFTSEQMPAVFENVHLKSSSQHTELMSDVYDVAKTAFSPHFSPLLGKFFSGVLVQLLPESDDSSAFSNTLSQLVEQFDRLCIKAENQPYKETRLFQLFLLKGEFAPRCHEQGRETRAVILAATVDQSSSEMEGKETMHVLGTKEWETSLDIRLHNTEALVKQCLDNHIGVVLCTEKIPSSALSVFQRSGVSVLQPVLQEDVDFLSFVCGKQVLTSAIDPVEEENIFSLKSCSSVIISGQRYVHLVPAGCVTPLQHLIVCGPTKGLCDQLSYVILKCLKSLLNCFDRIEILPYARLHSQACLSQDQSNDVKANEWPDIETCNNEQSLNGSKENVSCKLYETGHNGFSLKYDSHINTSVDESEGINGSFSVVAGGGWFEMMMSQLMKEISERSHDCNTSAICNILSEAFIAIPKCLQRNTAENSKTLGRKFLETEIRLQEAVCSGEAVGINRRGEVTDMLSAGVIEPFASKVHVVRCVLELVEQLLRIDRIVGVGTKDSDLPQ